MKASSRQTFGGELFGAGQLLDAARYFIILPDGIGHGKSSKPSDGLHARFPKYTYDDMVRAQHEMLVEGLKVTHLRLVMGTSMGAMHCWVWGEMYPDFVDGLVPLASAPAQIAGRNRVMRKMIVDSITRDPAWKNGDYTEPPRAGLVGAINLLMMMTSSPLQWHKSGPTREAADKWYEDQIRSRVAATDANDMLYQFNASRDYDPSPKLEKITAPLLAINSADDEVNPPELGLMEQLMPRVKRGRYVLIPTSDRTRGHGTHSLPAVWRAYPRLLEGSGAFVVPVATPPRRGADERLTKLSFEFRLPQVVDRGSLPRAILTTFFDGTGSLRRSAKGTHKVCNSEHRRPSECRTLSEMFTLYRHDETQNGIRSSSRTPPSRRPMAIPDGVGARVSAGIYPVPRIVRTAVLGVALVAIASTAQAVPAFARKYQTSCQTCHIVFRSSTPLEKRSVCAATACRGRPKR